MRGKLAFGAVALVSVLVTYQLVTSKEDQAQMALAEPQDELDKPMSAEEAAALEEALSAPSESAE
jgi:hypothetical protein